ncbi:MAG: PolC-type DNA polymerase III [Bacillales bacterium]|jgi:DNA polymerase-3 subunit alpha (Gram-positive type)|nr:PolC-type DNA polymerase III [Bacillales bacterium]
MNEPLKNILISLNIDTASFQDCWISNSTYNEVSERAIIEISANELFEPLKAFTLIQLLEQQNIEVVFKVENNALNNFNKFFALYVNKYSPTSYEYRALKGLTVTYLTEKDTLVFVGTAERIKLLERHESIFIDLKRLGIDKTIECHFEEDKEKLQEAIKEEAIKNFKENEKALIEERRLASQLPYKKVNLLKLVGKPVYLPGESRANISLESFILHDKSGNVFMKIFNKNETKKDLVDALKNNKLVEVTGRWEYDKYQNDYVLFPSRVTPLKAEEIKDEEEVKRVELHLHTNMSTKDGLGDIKEYIDKAISLNHPALAITDHVAVHALPDAFSYIQDLKNQGKPILKILNGAELHIFDDEVDIVFNQKDLPLDSSTYVIYDLETTGLNIKYDQIVEFGAIKIQNGQIIDRLETLFNPQMKISKSSMEVNHIKDSDVIHAPLLKNVIDRIINFFGDAVLVAHNTNFDFDFLNQKLKELDRPILTNTVVDTLGLARVLLGEKRAHSLKATAKQLNIEYDTESAHRSMYDVEVTKDVFVSFVDILIHEKKISLWSEINSYFKDLASSINRPYHVTVLVRNQKALKNLYELISQSLLTGNTSYAIPKSLLQKNREGLLLGSACSFGKIYDLVFSGKIEKAIIEAEFYDYIEVQPLENNSFKFDEGYLFQEENITRDLLFVANKANKIAVATGDVHYLGEDDKEAREALIFAKPAKGQSMHPLYSQTKNRNLTPVQHYRTTKEMLDCFDFLGAEVAYSIVVTNTNIISELIDNNIRPIIDHLHTPQMDNAERELNDLIVSNLHKMFGPNPPKSVQDRFDVEWNGIKAGGYSVVYSLASKIIRKCLGEKHMFGSRGSVGSSFVATLADITEVNPLPPYYICPKCYHFELIDNCESGYDVGDKFCPNCQTIMHGEGQNIPFETFLGVNGKKVPDIDLNFANDIQALVHKYIREMMGDMNAFRAGTISTIKSKTAYGYTKGYYEELARRQPVDKKESEADIRYLSSKLIGVKTTTGQHPGGIVIIPKNIEVYDVTPLQYPGTGENTEWKTTHYHFHQYQDTVLKLDILGHVDPLMLEYLFHSTGEDPTKLPLNDPEVIQLFLGTEVLGIKAEDIDSQVALAGMPEFGTKLGKGLVMQIRPQNYSQLVKISGISHGKNIWKGYQDNLYLSNKVVMNDIIGCRDDILVQLMKYGLTLNEAFPIMELVRKGKGKNLSPQQLQLMRDNSVPEWYIDTCLNISYMFPKAHAAAYTISALRVGWYKVHKPLYYYQAFLTNRCYKFEIDILLKGHRAVLNRLKELRNTNDFDDDEENEDEEGATKSTLPNLMKMYDVVVEMFARGFRLFNIDLMKSDAKEFVIDEKRNGLIIPFSALDSFGEAKASVLVEQRNIQPFKSKADLRKRGKVGQTVIEMMEALGILDGLEDEDFEGNIFDLL